MKIKIKTRLIALMLCCVLLLTGFMPSATNIEAEDDADEYVFDTTFSEHANETIPEKATETEQVEEATEAEAEEVTLSPVVAALKQTAIGSMNVWEDTEYHAVERGGGASAMSVPAGYEIYLERGGYMSYGSYVTDWYAVWMGEYALAHEGDRAYACPAFCACPSMTGPNTGHYSGESVQRLSEDADTLYTTLNVLKAVILTSPFGPLPDYRQDFWNVIDPNLEANAKVFTTVHAILGYLYDPGSHGTPFHWDATMQAQILGSGGLLEKITEWANANPGALSQVYMYRLKGNGLQDLVWLNAVPTYPVYVKKVSANPAVSDNDSYYSLEDAEYGIYRDAACTNFVGTLTTGDNGVSGVLYVSEGEYYAKELKAPRGFELNADVIGPVSVSATNNPGVFSTSDQPVPRTGSGKLVKRSSRPADTDGNEYYTLGNAEYTVYSDEQLRTSVGVLKTDTNGTSNVLELKPGTYYVKETKAPSGYEEDETVHTMVVKSDETAVLEVQDVYIPIFVTLEKKSTDPVITDQNDRYSLEGAEYAVYSDEGCTTSVGTLTTQEDGSSNVLMLPAGTYYAKEIKAPSGYRLNTEVYAVTATPGETAVFKASDTPLMVPMDFLKVDPYGNPVPGAQLQLMDKEGNVVDEWTSTTEPYRVERLLVGDSYMLHEVVPPEGYFSADDVVFTVEDSKEVQIVRMEDEQEPVIRTTATVKDSHIAAPVGTVELVDTVEYEKLVPGKEYTLNATLMDKITGGPVHDEKGNAISASYTFTPEKASGSVDVIFEIEDASLLAGKVTVVFESLSKDDRELAIHAEISDENQTVYWPSIGTNATVDGKKTTISGGTITLNDVVTYKGLQPGKEYMLKGVLMDKHTGELFLIDCKEVSAEAVFTPEALDGETTVTFIFDSSGITKKTDLVVFETVYADDVELLTHADIADTNQTVTINVPTPPSMPQTGDSMTSVWYWIGGAALSASIVCGAIFGYRRRRNRN